MGEAVHDAVFASLEIYVISSSFAPSNLLGLIFVVSAQSDAYSFPLIRLYVQIFSLDRDFSYY
ncbi:MAG: hypothetical protein A3K03_11680 [Bdellovibrionales bacterium RIFOXYD1_FULL_44_7]|nr:MAG: hypothetical protein A3K03_11680 [Bdellovibrionales bacterium RIFOXYD1_FULL_44_7]